MAHADTDMLLAEAAAGNADSWRAVLTRHEPRLQRMISFRMDKRLQGRIDPSDVLQETYLEAWKSLREHAREPAVPFFLWLRGIAGNKLMELHRRHLGIQKRNAARDVPLCGGLHDTTSAALAAQLLGHATRPSEAAIRAEVRLRLQQALNDMDPIDREILALRHFEQLRNAEAAQVLGIQERAAAKRYLRALQRLKQILADMPGGLSGL